MAKSLESLVDSLLEKLQFTVNDLADWAEKRARGLLGLARRFATPMRRESGLFAFVLHRLTGLFILLYLFVHIATVSNVNFSRGDFDDLMLILVSPPFLVFDLLLFLAVVLHAANGIRIVLFDVGVGTRHQKGAFWGALVISGILFIAFFYALLPLFAQAPGGRGG